VNRKQGIFHSSPKKKSSFEISGIFTNFNLVEKAAREILQSSVKNKKPARALQNNCIQQILTGISQ